MKKLIIFSSFLITGTVIGQTHYVNKLWEKESALLSGQQNHAQTLLDQNDNVLTVFNKKNNQAANIFSNKINSSGIETWQTEITNFLNIIGTENHGTDIKKDASGNIYICGANYNGLNYDYLIVKYDASGTELWRSSYNGTGNSDDAPSSMAIDIAGNVYVTGVSFGVGTMTDFTTLKLNGTNGNIIWTSRYDFSNKYDGATQVKLDSQGNVLVCGSSAQNLVNADFVVIKYNPTNGTQLQLKRHNSPQNGYDIAIGMEIDANNNVYVVGTANSNLANKDIKVIAYNTNLQINWVKYIDESGLEDDVIGIIRNAYEDLLITGSTRNLQGEIDLLTAKINKTNGNIIWKKVESNQSGITTSVGKGLDVDLNGNVVVVSEILKDNIAHIQAISYDNVGQKRWEYINKNPNLTNQRALDVLVKGKDVIITGTKETTSGDALITIKLEQKEIIVVPDFHGEKPVISFGLETNVGQLLHDDLSSASEVKFYNDRMNPAVFVTQKNIPLVFQKSHADSSKTVHRIDMDFVGSNPSQNIINLKEDELPGIKNYYLHHNPDGYLGIKDYSRIIMADIYPNVDVQYGSGINGMKYYIDVKPGANPDLVQLRFTGAVSILLNPDGSLNVHSACGGFTFRKPIAYQLDSNNQPVEIQNEGYFVQVDELSVKFYIRTYRIDQPLFIEIDEYVDTQPVTRAINNLTWSTYYGGDNLDLFNDVATDASGNVYFTGHSRGVAFPLATQALNFGTENLANATRMVVGKHRPYGVREWSTIYGGPRDEGYGIATDNMGNVYVVGRSQPGTYDFLDFPQGGGAYNFTNTIDNGSYASIYRFRQNDGFCTWATLFGENDPVSDFANFAVAVDPWNNVYVGGYGVRNGSSPVIASGGQHEQDPVSPFGLPYGTIMKFNAGVNSFAWSTIFGGPGTTIGEISITNNGDVYIVGRTTDFDVTEFPSRKEQENDYQQTYGGGDFDAFFAKFDSDDSLKWCSFLGGVNNDFGNGIDYNEQTHSLYITGQTQSDSASFPLKTIISNPDVHYSDVLGGIDGYITVLKDVPLDGDNGATFGHVLKYSSYYGGSNEDACVKLELSDYGTAYLIGHTRSQNFERKALVGGYNQEYLENSSAGNHFDGFVLALNPDLELAWSTFYGGDYTLGAASYDYPRGLAVYHNQYLFIGGGTICDTLFPITVDTVAYPNAYIQYDNSGDSTDVPTDIYDGFLAQFDLEGTILSVDELEKKTKNNINLLVYPNPNNGNFELVGENLTNGEVKIQMHNIVGQLVYTASDRVTNGLLVHAVQQKDLSKGLYIVKIKTKNSYLSTKVIIK